MSLKGLLVGQCRRGFQLKALGWTDDVAADNVAPTFLIRGEGRGVGASSTRGHIAPEVPSFGCGAVVVWAEERAARM